MIRYRLKCENEHSFESWFKSASAFETLQRAQHLSCPTCGSSKVAKSLMAPRITTARSKTASQEPAPLEEASPSGAPQGTDVASEKNTPNEAMNTNALHAQEVDTAIAKLRAHVEENSDYVGQDFTKQARAMKDGEAPERSIYGEAKLEDAKALIDEGVPVIPLPFTPKRKLS